MKKSLIVVSLALSAAVFSPPLVKCWTDTIVRTRDSRTQEPVANASVYLGPAQSCPTDFNWLNRTNSQGQVSIENIFSQYNANDMERNMLYKIKAYGHQNLWGGKTFKRGETTTLDLEPSTYCGDRICQPSENLQNCPNDCARCGDRICTNPPENRYNCPSDCYKSDDRVIISK